ncbi:MAG: hypothetical protein ABR530_09730 [Pyrinomonadaceae bacterium]
MRIKRIEQILISVLLGISLFVSPLAACVCSHHEQDQTEQTSCHEHEARADEPAAENESPSLSGYAECICVDALPQLTAKSETLKIKRTAAVLTTEPGGPSVELVAVQTTTSFSTASKGAPEPFFVAKPSRAPPIR